MPLVLRTLPPTSVTVQAGDCYGLCPVFDMEVDSNGTVDFTGKRFTIRSGHSEGRSPEEDYDRFVAELDQHRPLFSSSPGPEDCPADGQFVRVTWWVGPIPTSFLLVGDGCKGANNDTAIAAIWAGLEFVDIEHYMGTRAERKAREAVWMKESL
ncbi:MAG: DUF6438 domain-containing protein [Novosphingobium sp.]